MTQSSEVVTYQGKTLWYPDGLAGIQQLYDEGGVWKAKTIIDAVQHNAPGGHTVTPRYTSDRYSWVCVIRYAFFGSETYLFFPKQVYDEEKGIMVSERPIALAGNANAGLFALIQVGMKTRISRIRAKA